MTADQIAQWTLAGIAFTFIVLILVDKRRSQLAWQTWFLYMVDRIYLGIFFRARSNIRCPFPEEGPALIISNHRSPVDPLAMWLNHHLAFRRAAKRVTGHLMAAEYYDIFGIAWICRAMQSIPVARDGSDIKPLRDVLRRFKQKDLIVIFPEGGITGDGINLKAASSGVAWLALRSNVPVIPVFISGTPRVESMVASFWTHSRIFMTYGEPIDLSQYHGKKINEELLDDVTEFLMQQIMNLRPVAEEYIARRDNKIDGDVLMQFQPV